jgi:hypothetical protein
MAINIAVDAEWFDSSISQFLASEAGAEAGFISLYVRFDF